MRRPNNTGSISWDKINNKWRAWIKDDQGKRVIKRFADKADAENWLAEMRVKLNKGLYVPTNEKTFGEFAIEFLDVFCSNVRPKTQADYLYTLELMKPIHSHRLQKLNALQVQKLINDLPNNISTKKKVFSLAKRIIKKAFQLKLIDNDFSDIMKRPQNDGSNEIKVFTEEEIQKILNYSKNSQIYRRYYPLIYTAVLTGMRLGEILGLRYIDVTPTTITVNQTIVEVLGKPMISKPKTKAGRRTITIPEDLGNLLLNYDTKTAEPSYLIFRSQNNTPIRQNNFGKRFKTIQQLAGVEHKNFHCLRHSNASILIKNGYDIVSTSHRLGHAKSSTTLNFYSHFMPGKEDTAIDKLATVTEKGTEKDQIYTDYSDQKKKKIPTKPCGERIL